jgi:hypothetical protein
MLWGRHEHHGRPSSYSPDLSELAHNYCLLGATNDELAEFFGVSPRAAEAMGGLSSPPTPSRPTARGHARESRRRGLPRAEFLKIESPTASP